MFKQMPFSTQRGGSSRSARLRRRGQQRGRMRVQIGSSGASQRAAELPKAADGFGGGDKRVLERRQRVVLWQC